MVFSDGRNLCVFEIMNAKKLETDSDYADYDTDGDGVVSDDELETSKELQSLRLQFERANAQKTMAWFSLWGMLLYPSLVVCSVNRNWKYPSAASREDAMLWMGLVW